MNGQWNQNRNSSSFFSNVDAGIEADLLSLEFTSVSRERAFTFPNKSELQTSSCRGSGSVSKASWFYVTDKILLGRHTKWPLSQRTPRRHRGIGHPVM